MLPALLSRSVTSAPSCHATLTASSIVAWGAPFLRIRARLHAPSSVRFAAACCSSPSFTSLGSVSSSVGRDGVSPLPPRNELAACARRRVRDRERGVCFALGRVSRVGGMRREYGARHTLETPKP
eukprot:6558149-Prymnesium_polylepis.1